MATINPSQDYDIIHTLTYASSGGTAHILLYRGSTAAITGTVYYRAGTSGAWTSLAVSGTSTTFPITSTTMQIAHDWNKSGNNYMTPNFSGGTMTGIAISQKAALSGVMGNYFMRNYAYNCTSLTSLDIPDTSGLTSVGNYFMHNYAYNCTSLTSLAAPDTSGLTSAGDAFIYGYAENCSNLTSLEIPDTSGLTSVGSNFMGYYAYVCSKLTTLGVPDTSGLTSAGSYFMRNYTAGCTSLTTLNLPKAGWFKTNNVDWGMPSGRLGALGGYVLDSADLADWRALTVSGKTLYTNYIRSTNNIHPIPPAVDTGAVSGITLTGATVATSLGANPDSQTITERGVVYGTSANPTTANSKQTGTDSISLTGLTQDTTYYVRAYIIWSGGTVYGSQVSFKTQGRPVTTLNTPGASASVTELRPSLEFTGVDPDNNTITYQLQINTTNTFTSPALDLLSASDPGFSNRSDVKTDPFYSGNQIRYTPQADLTRGQDYYWRVRGKDTNGSDTWGNWTTARKFTVEPIPASITITGLGEIESASIEINANITDDGGATVTERGIVWSLSPNPTTSDSKATAAGNPFTATATGLTATTEYNFRAYAINSKGTSYSANITQMTLQTEGPPSLTTGEATGIYYTNATVGGEVTLDGRHPVTERGVVFSETANPTTADRKFTAPTAGLGAFSGAITGLDPDTVYYIRAYAINSQGTGYGTQKTFTTLALPEDEDDGYWVFSNTDSTAVVARTQSTPANSSANVFVEPFMERGETYTLHVGDIEADYGDPSLVLEYVEGTLQTIPIAPNTNHTFTYTQTMSLVRLRMYVTDDTAVAEELSATFHDLYLAKESSFSGFVNFERRGAKEVKIINNQILDKRREDTLPTIYPKLLGLRYTPFDIKTEGLGYFEVYDSFKIEDPNSDVKTVLLTDKTLTLDGGISETLQGKAPDKTDTDYSKAGGITKLISQTTLQVDKQRGEIEALVSDVYDNNGYIEEKFSQVYQNISEVRTTVQGAGGVNLIRNSVMYAYNNLGYPENWTTTHVDGEGSTIVIQGSPESQAAGGISAHSFILNGVKVNQIVTVRKDADFIPDENKTHYTFNVKVKKNLVGVGYIKLSNRQEEHIINLPNGEDYLWEDFTIEGLLPKDDYYEIEIYSDQDASAQFTDTMLSVGEYSHAWTQAPGEAMSMVKSDLVDGTYWRSGESRYEYSRINHQGLNVHKRIRGQQEEVFRFNSDEANMSKVRADKQIAMGKVRIVPIDVSGMSGWAWTGVEE